MPDCSVLGAQYRLDVKPRRRRGGPGWGRASRSGEASILRWPNGSGAP